jgi:hypothetical protein
MQSNAMSMIVMLLDLQMMAALNPPILFITALLVFSFLNMPSCQSCGERAKSTVSLDWIVKDTSKSFFEEEEKAARKRSSILSFFGEGWMPFFEF